MHRVSLADQLGVDCNQVLCIEVGKGRKSSWQKPAFLQLLTLSFQENFIAREHGVVFQRAAPAEP